MTIDDDDPFAIITDISPTVSSWSWMTTPSASSLLRLSLFLAAISAVVKTVVGIENNNNNKKKRKQNTTNTTNTTNDNNNYVLDDDSNEAQEQVQKMEHAEIKGSSISIPTSAAIHKTTTPNDKIMVACSFGNTSNGDNGDNGGDISDVAATTGGEDDDDDDGEGDIVTKKKEKGKKENESENENNDNMKPQPKINNNNNKNTNNYDTIFLVRHYDINDTTNNSNAISCYGGDMDEDDDNEEAVQVPVLALSTLLEPLLITILNYLAEERLQNDMGNVCCLNKQFYRIAHLSSITTVLIPTYELSPKQLNTKQQQQQQSGQAAVAAAAHSERCTTSSCGGGTQRTLVERLMTNRLYNNTKFRYYRYVKLHSLHTYSDIGETDWKVLLEQITTARFPHIDEINNSNTGIPVNDIQVLDMSLEATQSSTTTTTQTLNAFLLPALRMIFMTVNEINLSYCRFNMSFSNKANPTTVTETTLNLFFNHMCFVRKVVWTNSDRNVYMHGNPISNNPDIQELYLDHSILNISSLNREYLAQLCDLEEDEDFYLLYGCKRLVRVSLKGCSCTTKFNSTHHPIIPIPQNALIKFVRSAPNTLRYFCSDLTNENIRLLQKERPAIELIN